MFLSSVEIRGLEFSGIGGGTGRKRLKDVEGVPVAKGPCGERQHREQPQKQRDAQRPREPKRAAAIEDERGKEDDGQQGAIGPQQRGVAPGKGEGQHPSPVRALEHGGKGVEAERNAKNGKRFGEGHGHVICREGTERRQPKRHHRRPGPAEPANESRDEQARHQVNHHLQVENGEVVLQSKSREAEGEEAGISGQPDEGGGNRWRRRPHERRTGHRCRGSASSWRCPRKEGSLPGSAGKA
jgi:hypothetical protein